VLCRLCPSKFAPPPVSVIWALCTSSMYSSSQMLVNRHHSPTQMSCPNGGRKTSLFQTHLQQRNLSNHLIHLVHLIHSIFVSNTFAIKEPLFQKRLHKKELFKSPDSFDSPGSPGSPDSFHLCFKHICNKGTSQII
jgi:hypothetical protein